MSANQTEASDVASESVEDVVPNATDIVDTAQNHNTKGSIQLEDDATETSKLSKNQQKKLKRRQEWEDRRPARKAARKEKRIAAKERKRKAMGHGEIPPKPAQQTHVRPTQVPVTIIIDCQFEGQMTPEELVSMASQVTRCYSDCRKAKYRTHLAISSFGGALRERFEGILLNQHKTWDVEFHDAHFTEVAKEATEWMTGPRGGELAGALSRPNRVPETEANSTESMRQCGEVVYLTSDSPNTLQTLQPYSTYIIGGIVDKNRHKGICYQRACDYEVKTAKLPISEHIKMSSRQVLTTNHVNEIMLKWLEFEDWSRAFMAVIPPRKGGVLIKPGQSEPSQRDGGEEEKGFRGTEYCQEAV